MGLFFPKDAPCVPPLTVIETERLRIVPLSRAEFTEKLHSDFGGAEFHEAMEELWERARHDRASRFGWYTNRLIYRKEDGAYIGSIAAMNSPERDPDKLGLIEIGYALDEPYRGNGYMTEAVGGFAGWILAQNKVYGVIGGVLDDNPASSRVLERNGFVMTDHSDTLSLQVWKKIPDGRRPITWKERLF